MSDNTASAKAGTKGSDAGEETRASEPSFNLAEIRELAELVNEYGFTDFRFENENIKVRLSKQVQVASMPAVQTAPAVAQSAPEASTESAAEPDADHDAGLHKITSPIVGTFYRAPGPDKEPYVKEGSTVSADSVVCIVEAMKLMNEIQAEVSGEVVKIYVENGEPVEYGQPLFGIRK
ncbi:MAG TPA: acetyl-CoA carboxylase biotin carboxyl carrier protein [Pyrinomonadaceae bacterium]|nr:acetyl-CoA carboxylase biotin carboxyl carrier protein [Pyrinomonadaceae bacterium]HMP66093.1 acetyl-CoA carboxylase biotin carboxyl carrier protein [Pyrinomonadaceae bacterium]